MGFISTKMSSHVQVLSQALFRNVLCPFHFHEKSFKALTSLVTVLCGVYTQVSIISKHLCPVWMEEWVSLMTDRSTLIFKGELYNFLFCPCAGFHDPGGFEQGEVPPRPCLAKRGLI